MILVDANLLIYAVDRDSAEHKVAGPWLETVLSGSRTVALPWIALVAFVRITTRRGIMRNPLDAESALGVVDSWLERPCVMPLAPGEHHWRSFRNLIAASGTAGNLTSDAHIAALALEHGATVYSADNDFKRFRGVRHVNPLA